VLGRASSGIANLAAAILAIGDDSNRVVLESTRRVTLLVGHGTVKKLHLPWPEGSFAAWRQLKQQPHEKPRLAKVIRPIT
jgi:hypothetical protein